MTATAATSTPTDIDTRTVEDRLEDIQNALAVATIVTSALAHVRSAQQDLLLSRELEGRALHALAGLYSEAYGDLEIVQELLNAHPSDALFLRK